MFSHRLKGNFARNPLFKLCDTRKSSRSKLFDLTRSNPTQADFNFGEQRLLRALRNPEALIYEPDPRGLPAARNAVCGYYRKQGKEVDPDSLFLTASTSEAYSYLIKLLCSPGEEIMVPMPGYPLLEPLAELESVRLVHYPLHYHSGSGWSIDVNRLASSISTKTKAIVAVSPGNPAGSYVKKNERAALSRLCREHEMALILDEVFLDYYAEGTGAAVSAALDGGNALTFILSGFSKILALPQVKLGWIQMSGPASLCKRAGDRIEYIADTFLSVNSMVQYAAAGLLKERERIQKQILRRISDNEKFLMECVKDRSGICLLKREGGWYGVLKIRCTGSDEEMAIGLLKKKNVFVHPGYFYGFKDEGYLVLSLITKPDTFREGISRLASFF
jgi:aspartate/methionine/tyrosine aminotransferase